MGVECPSDFGANLVQHSTKSSAFAELFVFARIILSIVGVDVLGDPNERKLNGTPGRSSPTKSGRAVQFVKN